MRDYDDVKERGNRTSKVTCLLPAFNSVLCPPFKPGMSSKRVNSVGSLLGTAFFPFFKINTLSWSDTLTAWVDMRHVEFRCWVDPHSKPLLNWYINFNWTGMMELNLILVLHNKIQKHSFIITIILASCPVKRHLCWTPVLAIFSNIFHHFGLQSTFKTMSCQFFLEWETCNFLLA